jgi:hypothetical protein
MEIAPVILVVLGLVLAAEFVNGWTDAPNAIATVVSTRVMSPGSALLMASALNILGTMSGTAVAATIGKGIVRPDVINVYTVGAAMVGIVLWSTLAWYYGLPTSESHGLIAGLTGAALATAGPDALLWAGWKKVLLGLGFSTFLGFGGGFACQGPPGGRPTAVREAPGDLSRLHGVQPRLERRPEVRRDLHPGALAGRADSGVPRLPLGHLPVRRDHGRRHRDRRMAHHENPGIEINASSTCTRICG